MIAILEYGAGNQTSVQRALTHVGIACEITADPARLQAAQGVIFPGVGAAGQAMNALRAAGLDAVLRDLVRSGKPFLGVCLGCQIMLARSEENDTFTLGLVEGVCRRFDPAWTDEDGTRIRIPHMGWNTLLGRRSSALLAHIPVDAAFYFVHSYYVDVPQHLVIANARYGRDFCAVYGQDGLWAVQFHPEKSGPHGLQVLQNFATFCHEGRIC